MSPKYPLVDVIGSTSVDHPAFLVRTGMFVGAYSLFSEQLGWAIVRRAGDIDSLGWRAIFLEPVSGGGQIQLTEEASHPDTPVIFPGTHLGLKVFDAEEAANALKSYYERAGIDCEIEPANPEKTKWFVQIPELFTFSLEFVSVGVEPSAPPQEIRERLYTSRPITST